MYIINCNNQSSLIDALSVWTEIGQTFVVRLVLRLKNKDNHNTHYMGADEPSFVVRRSKCITKDSNVRLDAQRVVIPETQIIRVLLDG